MTTTIANAKQVKIDMQKRIELDEKTNTEEEEEEMDDDDDEEEEVEDVNSKNLQELQEQVSRQHAMMMMASTGATTTTTISTTKSNTPYPHVSVMKSSDSVPMVVPVEPKQHVKPLYVESQSAFISSYLLIKMNTPNTGTRRIVIFSERQRS